MELTESPDGPDASDDDDEPPPPPQADKKANRKQTSESFSNFILWHPKILQKLNIIYTNLCFKLNYLKEVNIKKKLISKILKLVIRVTKRPKDK